MTILYGKEVSDWVTNKLGVARNAYGFNTSEVGLVKSGNIVAGVVYCNFNGYNLHAHIASDGTKRWANREFLREIFKYPFETIGTPRITATTSDRNQSAIDFLLKVGFQYELPMERAASDGSDLHVFRMFKEECTWLSL